MTTGWQAILCDSSWTLLSTIASASWSASQASYSKPTGVSWLGTDKHSEITLYTARQRGTRAVASKHKHGISFVCCFEKLLGWRRAQDSTVVALSASSDVEKFGGQSKLPCQCRLLGFVHEPSSEYQGAPSYCKKQASPPSFIFLALLIHTAFIHKHKRLIYFRCQRLLTR